MPVYNSPFGVEIIDAEELARRLHVRASWIRDNVRTRAADPIPHLKLGRRVLFEWGEAELAAWIERRRRNYTGNNTKETLRRF